MINIYLLLLMMGISYQNQLLSVAYKNLKSIRINEFMMERQAATTAAVTPAQASANRQEGKS